MKLNKKGFGVAEIAIVILLIGILAAAVIAGFMGIKQNAHNAVVSQQEIAESMDHNLKHSFPTILSKNQKGLEIGEGKYEVYELGGYKIVPNSSGAYPVQVNEGATLYLSGNGTTDVISKVDGTSKPKNPTVVNYGNLYLSDIVVEGGDINRANREYQFWGMQYSVSELNNVVVSCGTRGILMYFDANIKIDGVNSKIEMRKNNGVSGQNLFYLYPRSVTTVNNGTLTCKQQHNTMFYSAAGKIIINGGYFTDTLDAANVGNNQIFYFASYRVDENTLLTPITEINGGVFDCTVCSCSNCKNDITKAFFYFYDSSSVTITGGEFIKEPSRFATGVNQTNRILIIKDAPNDGTEQLIFHYAPYKEDNTNVWGDYVAEGYEVYEIEAGKLWGVKPVTTPAN